MLCWNAHVDGRGEREILIALLAALQDPPRAAALPADAGAVLAVARHHRLSPLLDATCAAHLVPELAAGARRDRALTLARNLVLEQTAEECLLGLTAAGIETVILKGLAYERLLYGQAGCRPAGDVDLLVRGESRRRAFDALSALGFEPRAAAPGFDDADYHEVAWTRGLVTVDLHLALAPLARCAIDYEAVWSSVRPTEVGRARALLLAPPHAAVFHALHMAIDHFDVPALYLLDLARLLPRAAETAAAERDSRAWRCARPFATARALTAAFLPSWEGCAASDGGADPRAAAVIAGFGTTAPLPRLEQLRRKLSHIDGAGDALRYLAVQARRNLREIYERRVRRRTPRERLGLARPTGV